MDFNKKIKVRITYNILVMILGAVMIALRVMGYAAEIFYSYGIAYFLCGLMLTVKNCIIISNPEKMKKLEIVEKDERNLMIYRKAIQWAFISYIYASGVAMLILSGMGFDMAAEVVALCLCGLVLIYFVCYNIVKKIN